MGTDINFDRSFTMAKASASRPAGLVICGEWVSQLDIEITKDDDFRAWRLKSNCVIVLVRWSNRSSWLVELGERYTVQ